MGASRAIWFDVQLEHLWRNVLHFNRRACCARTRGGHRFGTCGDARAAGLLFVGKFSQLGAVPTLLVFRRRHLAGIVCVGILELIRVHAKLDSYCMKSISRYMLRAFVIVSLLANAAHACPNCFASSKSQALEAYYVSILFMALIPFGMVAALFFWLRHRLRSTR